MLDLDDLKLSDAYKKHQLFEEINYIREFYDSLSFSSIFIYPKGTTAYLNFASYIYTAIQGTLDSIQTLLRIGRINDAYTLVRKYFDDVLLEIYIDVIRKEKFDREECLVVKDVDEWLKGKHRIPTLRKLLLILEQSDFTKDIYTFFGWNTYFKHNRDFLDDSVHGNRYSLIILNCNRIAIENREKHLQNILIIINQIFVMHLAFIFHLNPMFLRASDYMDNIEMNMKPPKGSENRIAPFAQQAFDKYLKQKKYSLKGCIYN